MGTHCHIAPGHDRGVKWQSPAAGERSRSKHLRSPVRLNRRRAHFARVYDLVVGIFVIGLLSALLFVTSLRLSRTLGDRTVHLLGILTVALIVCYVVHVQGHPELSRVLPFSNLIVVSNWQPLLVSVLAGLMWHRMPGRAWRRALPTTA